MAPSFPRSGVRALFRPSEPIRSRAPHSGNPGSVGYYECPDCRHCQNANADIARQGIPGSLFKGLMAAANAHNGMNTSPSVR